MSWAVMIISATVRKECSRYVSFDSLTRGLGCYMYRLHPSTSAGLAGSEVLGGKPIFSLHWIIIGCLGGINAFLMVVSNIIGSQVSANGKVFCLVDRPHIVLCKIYWPLRFRCRTYPNHIHRRLKIFRISPAHESQAGTGPRNFCAPIEYDDRTMTHRMQGSESGALVSAQ